MIKKTCEIIILLITLMQTSIYPAKDWPVLLIKSTGWDLPGKAK